MGAQMVVARLHAGGTHVAVSGHVGERSRCSGSSTSYTTELRSISRASASTGSVCRPGYAAKLSTVVPRATNEGNQPSTSGSEEEIAEYKDSMTDLAFIALCRVAYGNLAGWQSSRDWWDGEETYKGMVEVSRALMKGKSAEEQQAAVIQGFPEVPDWFRKAFPYSKWGAEANAWITPTFFRWLVGPMERREAEINGQTQNSSVYIKRCRYLAESGCAGMCVNLCKSPVQTFFTRELGMPLTMKPNFEDYSCEMVFGQVPPPKEEDEAYQQRCLHSCPVGSATQPQCPKLQ